MYVSLEPPSVQVLMPSVFPADAEANYFEVTIRFSEDISGLAFNNFTNLTSWQTLGGVNGVIVFVSQPTNREIVEWIWPIQKGRVTIQVPGNVFSRNYGNLDHNNPSNTLIVYHGCGMLWGEGLTHSTIEDTNAESWWHCSRLCLENPSCESFTFDARNGQPGGGSVPAPCRLYDQAELSGSVNPAQVSSARACSVNADVKAPEMMIVRRGDTSALPLPGGSVPNFYNHPNYIHLFAEIHFTEPVKHIDPSDLDIHCTNCTFDGGLGWVHLAPLHQENVTWPLWSDKWGVEIRLDELPPGFTTAKVVIGLDPSHNVADFSGNLVSNTPATIEFIVQPGCDTFKQYNGEVLFSGNLFNWHGAPGFTYNECAAACRNTPECRGFSFHNAGSCFLKWGADPAPDGWNQFPDGNYDSGIRDCACAANCLDIEPEAKCGDYIVTGSETCDDGNDMGGDGCSATCQTESGYTCPTPGEICEPLCGDGLVIGGEQCDDGNTAVGDGCDDNCLLEVGWVCSTPGFPCDPICGDGQLKGSEQCDDGNTAAGDGCSDTCQIESGYTCPTPSASCVPVCGDGLLVGGEECDDGNTAAGDGCSDTCQIEAGYTCPTPGSPCFLITTAPPTTAPPPPVTTAPPPPPPTTLPPSTTAQPPPATTAAPTTGPVTTAPPTTVPQPGIPTTEPPMAPTTGAPPVLVPPVDVDDITDDLDNLKNPDAVDISDAEDTIGSLVGGEGEEPPTPPPVDSPEDFSSRLLKTINVAKVARKEDMAGLAKPNSTQEETKAQRNAVVKALMRNLQKAAIDRSTKLSDVSSSPAEVLLSAVTLATTVEVADETENDDMDTAEAGVATFKALAAVSADTISQPDDTLADAVKELQGLQYYLDGAAGLLRQLNRTAKADGHLRRLTPAANGTYHTLSSDIIGTTAQLADSLATRAAAHPNGTAEVVGAKTRLRVARTDTASGATLTMKETSVAVDMPSLPSIPPAVCADGGGLRESVQMTFWADDPYAYAAQEEVPMANLTANDTLRNAAQGTLAVSARQCGSDLQLTAGDGQQRPFRLFIPRPSADSVPAAGNASVNGTERAYDVHVVCGFWNASTHQWDTQGCHVNLALSNETTLCCECTHLTEFSSLFRSVIVDSHIAGVVGGAGDSLARMADITAWTQNIAAFFVSIMIAIHTTCLILSVYFDCKHPITDEILLDIWMTDPLLE
ncbi:unnamed protein product [Vitrella brassicaformis CCMP3155]|uniref:Apple domain-containing protein n=2 Tax=Vitrella brassicaformis TaxID=1169539 RepID=A0A0G4GN70_VITBC|nr:unnamed protein product [Vitrella brassicaformis CCMP3155]|eukprot:CEM31599.1 unnamed protein product [Vitrella brassicaformis CCMP3155]